MIGLPIFRPSSGASEGEGTFSSPSLKSLDVALPLAKF